MYTDTMKDRTRDTTIDNQPPEATIDTSTEAGIDTEIDRDTEEMIDKETVMEGIKEGAGTDQTTGPIFR